MKRAAALHSIYFSRVTTKLQLRGTVFEIGLKNFIFAKIRAVQTFLFLRNLKTEKKTEKREFYQLPI